MLKTSGQIKIVPDEASISIQINCSNKNIYKAKDCLIDKSNMLKDDLMKHGIDGKDILTTRVDLNKDYKWRNSSYIFNGYMASTSVNVIVRDLKTLESLYPDLLTNKQFTIGGLTYYHSNIDSLNNAAYIEALKNADNLVDEILINLPEKNKMITQVSNMKISPSSNNYKVQANKFKLEEEVREDKMLVNIGEMMVQQQLYVEYKVY